MCFCVVHWAPRKRCSRFIYCHVYDGVVCPLHSKEFMLAELSPLFLLQLEEVAPIVNLFKFICHMFTVDFGEVQEKTIKGAGVVGKQLE